jgi:hypothetical protein
MLNCMWRTRKGVHSRESCNKNSGTSDIIDSSHHRASGCIFSMNFHNSHLYYMTYERLDGMCKFYGQNHIYAYLWVYICLCYMEIKCRTYVSCRVLILIQSVIIYNQHALNVTNYQLTNCLTDAEPFFETWYLSQLIKKFLLFNGVHCFRNIKMKCKLPFSRWNVKIFQCLIS